MLEKQQAVKAQTCTDHLPAVIAFLVHTLLFRWSFSTLHSFRACSAAGLPTSHLAKSSGPRWPRQHRPPGPGSRAQAASAETPQSPITSRPRRWRCIPRTPRWSRPPWRPHPARRNGEAARATATASRTPRVHPRAPSSSFAPSSPQSTSCCLFLPASTGLSHRPLASAVGVSWRGATQQESATAGGSKTLQLRPSSATSCKVLSPGSSCSLFLPAMPHLKAASTGFRVAVCRCACSEDLWTADPTGDHGNPGGLPPPRDVPEYPGISPRKDLKRAACAPNTCGVCPVVPHAPYTSACGP